jgi:hypothetical protein
MELKNALDEAVNASTPADRSRANLATVGAQLQKLLPDFDSRNYGFQKLSELVERIPTFKLVRESTAAGPQVVYVERN